MKCDICGKEEAPLEETERQGRSMMICRTCLETKADDASCRCKETVGKSTSEILKMVVKDMVGRKK